MLVFNHVAGVLRRGLGVGALALALVAAGTVPAGATVSGGAPTAPAPAAVRTAAGDDVTFSGHGWGHGRGMGQYGALGYAVDHGWGYRQILGHFYGGTTVGSVGNRAISVELINQTGTELRAIGRGLTVNGVPQPDRNLDGSSVRVTPEGLGFRVEVAATCAAPGAQTWTHLGSFPTVVVGTTSQNDFASLPRVCEPTGERGYRGSLSVQRHAATGVPTTFNQTSVEDYLRGVVPRESPDSWGALGGGRGMEALKAQAVAARSYALSAARPSGATTCDTTACQVYSGATFQPWNGARTVLDGPNANVAINQTVGEVRFTGGTSTVSRTEFSSSTGGYTAGGTFPAVVDEGDDIASNPNHSWAATFTASEIATKLGITGLRSVAVTGRNGLGDWGGRVTTVAVVDGAGSTHTFTGPEFRTAMGTSRFKSDWFMVSWISLADAQSIVKALYQDLLGRQPDPTGLSGWSTALLQGTSQSVLVSTLTRSDEYISLRVAKAYREVLGREPEPAGALSWLQAIQSGAATVDDVQRRFYDSTEYFDISGGTVDTYIARLYVTMLRRAASASEIASWASLMQQYGRAWAVDSIWFSMEAARIRAGDYYQTFLGRGPDPDGQTAWAQVLLTYGEGAVRAGIAGSLEYRARAIARFP